MKKDALIQLLSNIKGNPDVVLWNPYVGDFNPILDVSSCKLYKESVELNFNALKAEAYGLCKEPLTDEQIQSLRLQAEDMVRKSGYSLPNEYVQEDEMDFWYQKRTKKVVVITPKKVGKKSYGRHKYEDVGY